MNNSIFLVLWATLQTAPVEQTLPIAPDGTVQIHNVSGSVKVRTHASSEVRLRATLTGEQRIGFEATPDGVMIRVDTDNCCKGRGGDADLEVIIPERAGLKVRVVSARVDTVSGGDLDVRTVNGRVKAEAHGRNLRVKTVNGDVTITAKMTDATLESVNGSLDLTAERLTLLDVRTISGDTTVRADAIDKGAHQIKTHSGRVTIVVPDGEKVRVPVRSFRNGRVLGDPSDDATTIDVKTFTDDVRLERR